MILSFMAKASRSSCNAPFRLARFVPLFLFSFFFCLNLLLLLQFFFSPLMQFARDASTLGIKDLRAGRDFLLLVSDFWRSLLKESLQLRLITYWIGLPIVAIAFGYRIYCISCINLSNNRLWIVSIMYESESCLHLLLS